jgi:hydrogenase-4 component B
MAEVGEIILSSSIVPNTTLFSVAFFVGICLLCGTFVAVLRRYHWIGHAAGMIASCGLVIAGLAGLFEPPKQVLFRGVYDFTSLTFRLNPLAGFFLLLIGLVGWFVSVYGIGYTREYRGRKSVALLSAGVLVFLVTMASVILAGNVFTFLVSWESMSIVSYLLVMFEHERKEIQKAGFIYVVMTHLGTAFLTIAFLVMARYAGSSSFQSMEAIHMPLTVKTVVFLLALIGFGTKAGLVPLHIWLPRAHPVAPSHVSALMSGVMIKTAVYGFVLVVFRFLAAGPIWWGVLVALFGAISALLGVIYALGQSDQKRMLAYSSIENMGLIFLGLGVSLMLQSLHNAELAAFAELSTLVHAFNHALFKSLLFLGAGAVLSKTHTKNMDLLGGLVRSMPWTAAFTLIGALSISAMPPFNGFVGEWMLFQSGFVLATSAHSVWLRLFAVLLIGALTMTGALVAMAFVRSFGLTFLALPRSEHAKKADEVDVSMRIGMGGLAVLCVLLGIFSTQWIRILRNPVKLITGGSLPSESWHPLDSISRGTAHVSVLGAVMIAYCAFIFTWLMLRVLGGKTSTVRRETWTCGGTLTPAMTYTASGYSKPIRVAFQRILRPSRTLNCAEGSRYFPSKLVYSSRLKAFAETYLYLPVVNMVVRISQVVRAIQNGQVQTYLAYLFVTLIVVLFLVKWR